jgi:hypothetical protein
VTEHGKKKKKAKKSAKKTDTEKISKPISKKKGNKAKVLAAIGKRAKDHQQIIDDAGLEKPQYGYLRQLVTEGLIEKTEKGYILVK